MDDLMEALEEIEAGLDSTLSAVNSAVDIARGYGGEVRRVVAGQLRSYLLGTLEAFRDDESQPGSVAGLRAFLEEMGQEDEEVSCGQAV